MAKSKKGPLDIVEEEADRIRALYQRFANAPWMQAMDSLEVRDLGLEPTDYAQVFGILREPLYRGAVRHGDKEVLHEPYRLVDDDLWNRAVDGLPKVEAPAMGKSENALETVAAVFDQASTIRAVATALRIQCPGPKCKGRGHLRWDGVKLTKEGFRIPVLRCSKKTCNHRTPLLTSLDLQTLGAKFRCLDCDASALADFQQTYDRASEKYTVRCLQCGWKVSAKKPVFGEFDRKQLTPAKPVEANGQQRLIPGAPKPRKAPGRRRRKRSN